MIDIYKAIADLREQQRRVERAILAIEEMARLRQPRRGRPPKWLSSAAKTSSHREVRTQSAKT
jgi:hypothetical protein